MSKNKNDLDEVMDEYDDNNCMVIQVALTGMEEGIEAEVSSYFMSQSLISEPSSITMNGTKYFVSSYIASQIINMIVM